MKQQMLALAAAALLATGCAHGTQAAQNAASDHDATVKVSNQNWSDMTVYLVRSGAKYRLGTVTSMTARAFKLPWTMLAGSGDVRLVADPIGSSRTFSSPPVMVGPGETLEWQLENSIGLSSMRVR